MKKILFILISLAFLQAPANICFGNTPEKYICAYAVDQSKNSKESPEEQTEENFHSFIAKDAIGGKAVSKSEGTYYYTGFSDANKALNNIVNFITPAEERLKFNKTQEYKSDLIAVVWKENTKEKTVVKDGFAQIEVTFMKRGKVKYTIVFCKK